MTGDGESVNKYSPRILIAGTINTRANSRNEPQFGCASTMTNVFSALETFADALYKFINVCNVMSSVLRKHFGWNDNGKRKRRDRAWLASIGSGAAMRRSMANDLTSAGKQLIVNQLRRWCVARFRRTDM